MLPFTLSRGSLRPRLRASLLVFTFALPACFSHRAGAQQPEPEPTQSPAPATPAAAAAAPTSAPQPSPPALPERGLDFDTQNDSSAYHRLVAEAVAEHSAGHWAEARALFLRAHELDPSARTLRALGMTAFELREYPDAVRELSASLVHPRYPLSSAQRRRVLVLLERANTFVGRYQVRLEPAQAHLQVNGLLVQLEADGTLLLPLGRQLLSAEAAGYQTAQQALVVNGSDGQTLSFKLEPLWWARGALPPLLMESPSELGTAVPSSRDTRLDREDVYGPSRPLVGRSPGATSLQARHFRDHPWSWAATGSAVGLAGTSLALWLRARHEDETLRERYADSGPPHPQEAMATRDRLRHWSAVTLGASVALLASAVVIYVIEGRAVKSASK